MKKWIIILLGLCAFSISAVAQLPIPVFSDLLPKSEHEIGVLHQTHVTLTGSNYTIVQENIIGRSRGFKVLGLISLRSASYIEAVTRLYARAKVQVGHPQALANVVYESTSSNFILFSIPKVKIRADLIEFTEEGSADEDMGNPTPVLLGNKPRS
jgi:hypothetical protein